MRRDILVTIILAMTLAPPAEARTFSGAPLAPEVGLDVLTRRVTRERVGRSLFADPYATVTIGNVDVYDRFPYVEARRFQIVSDPRWNRLVFGEAGRSLSAFDGRGTALGALSDPHGLAVDDANRVYVSDTGNDRVVVLEAVTGLGEIELRPLHAIEGLSRPYDLAFSDGGTPFQAGDDFLYVADTGKNRVVAIALGPTGGRITATLGDLGSGPGRFAGPMAIAVGRLAGANTRDVYVADAHNRRLVHLRHEGQGLRWVRDAGHDAEILTSLTTDAWGNLYAAAPHRGTVQKFNSALAPVAELRGGLSRPKSFHVPVFNVRDHRDGKASRVGQARGVSVEHWSEATGIRGWNLGVEVAGLGVTGGERPEARFTLTDHAVVTLETRDASSGRALGRRTLGALAAGTHAVTLVDQDLGPAAGSGDVVLRLSAASSHPEGDSDAAETRFHASGVAATRPSQPLLLGNWPNPVSLFTRITFVLPDGAARATLGVFDASGRRVRDLGDGFAPGLNEVSWDGTDDTGRHVRAGVYFYRLETAGRRLGRQLVVIR